MGLPEHPLYFQDNPLFFCRPGTLVDVGCNIGFHLSQFMMFDGPKHIVAYEPKRQLALELIAKTYQINGGVWPADVEIFHMALGNSVGRIKLSTPKIQGRPQFGWSSVVDHTFDMDIATTRYHGQCEIEEEYVQISTLDSQNLQNVTFLKIDVEGAEEDVLRGGMELLKQWRPIINIELQEFTRAGCTTSVRALLESLGYKGFFMYGNNQVFPMEHFRPELHQISEYDGFCVVNKTEPFIWEFQFIHQNDDWGMQKLVEHYGPVQDYIPPKSGT